MDIIDRRKELSIMVEKRKNSSQLFQNTSLKDNYSMQTLDLTHNEEYPTQVNINENPIIIDIDEAIKSSKAKTKLKNILDGSN